MSRFSSVVFVLMLVCGMLASLFSIGCSKQPNSAAASSAETSLSSAVEELDPVLRQRIPKIRFEGSALVTKSSRLAVEQIEEAGIQTHQIFDIYAEKEKQYSGLWLKDLVEIYAPNATVVKLTAVDDYCVSFTKEDWSTHPVFFATRDHGKHFSVSEKGPARIVIQFSDEQTSLRETLRPKWIWQITTVSFE